MAENYGTLEGTLDEHGVLSGEMNDRATLEGEIQFGSGGGGVLDVFQNGQSVVQGRYAYVTVPTFLKDLRSDDYHNTVTTLEIQKWNGKADPSDIPTALSQLDNDANYVQDADYVHTDNNFTDEDKAAIGNIPENITDLSDVAVDNIQNGQILKWDATQEKFVNADESGGGGDITDVKVDGISVVDPVTKEANIDLTDYAKTEDIPTDLADLSDDATHRLVTDTEKDTWDSKSDFSGDYNDLDNLPTLGTAAAKNSTALITSGSTDVAEAGAVRDAIDSAVSSSYHHAGTKTCAELVSSLLVRANEGNVYNMTDSGVTTADFIEGAGKPIEEGANVGIAKIAENTYKFDLLSGFVDTSTFIEKSATSGLVRNDGSIDESDYALESDIPDISGKANKSEMSVAISGDQTTIQLKNGTSATVINQHQDISGKVDKDGDKVLSDNNYTDTDKDKVATIGNKADKVTNATNGNLAGLNGSGNPTDSGISGDMTTTSATGNPISIADLKSAQIALNPVITFEPIQAGSGTPSPSNIRAISGYDKIEVLSTNRNIWGEDWEVGAIDNSTGQNNNSDLTQIRVKGYILIAPNTTYAFSCPNTSIRIYWYDIDKTFISSDAILNSTAVSPSNAHYLRIRSTGSYGNTYKNDIMVTCGNDASVAYEPSVKTTDLSESLGQTVYGGTYDVRTGLFTVKYQTYTMTGDENFINQDYGAGVKIFYLPFYVKRTSSGRPSYSSHFVEDPSYAGWAGVEPGQFITVQNNYCGFYYNGYNADAKSWVQTQYNNGTPVQFTVLIKTPFTIQLTPHEIALSQGHNYISTNGTSISMAYHNGELATHADVEQLAETVNLLPYGLLKFKTYTLTPNANGRISLEVIDNMIPLHIICETRGIYVTLRKSAGTNYYYARCTTDTGEAYTTQAETFTVYGLPIK